MNIKNTMNFSLNFPFEKWIQKLGIPKPILSHIFWAFQSSKFEFKIFDHNKLEFIIQSSIKNDRFQMLIDRIYVS